MRLMEEPGSEIPMYPVSFSPTRDTELIDLQQQVARLQALLEAARQIHSIPSLEHMLTRVLEIVVRELEMPGALFTAPPLSYGATPTPPWDSCARFPLHDQEGVLLTELVVALPQDQQLSIFEQDFLEGLALQAGVAVENAHFHQRTLEWVRVQRDLDAARLIQRSLLPQQMPTIPGYSLAVRSSTCYEVGGDYVDIVGLPDGSHMMAVADVAGKGLASAIVSTSFRSAFRAMAVAGLPLDELAARLNDQHYAEGPESRGRYVTAIFLKLDAEAHTIEVVNAGHNPGFLMGPDKSVREIQASGTPLGLIPGMSYKTEQLAFPQGSRLLLYTDGLTEVFRDVEEFGSDRLRAAFLECNCAECNAILDTLWTTLHEFSGGAPQEDDMTALAILRIPNESEPDERERPR
jgi:sigma-B regulation protein RsbU (phosphoserine phosphatase)